MATAFGVIAIVLGVLGSFIAGWVGVGIVAIFGGLAIFFRIKKNKEAEAASENGEAYGSKRYGAIVCGIIGIILAVIIQFGIISFANRLKETASQMQGVELVTTGADGFKSLGIIGFISKASDAKGSMSDTEFGDQLKEQLEKVSKEMN